jgi:hypothetical protein
MFEYFNSQPEGVSRWNSGRSPYDGQTFGHYGWALSPSNLKAEAERRLGTRSGTSAPADPEVSIPAYSERARLHAESAKKRWPGAAAEAHRWNDRKVDRRFKEWSAVELTQFMAGVRAIGATQPNSPPNPNRPLDFENFEDGNPTDPDYTRKKEAPKRIALLKKLKLKRDIKRQEAELTAKDELAEEQGYESWQEMESINLVKFEWYTTLYQLVKEGGGSHLDPLFIPALEQAEVQLFGTSSYEAKKSGATATPRILTAAQVTQILAGQQLVLETAVAEVELRDETEKLELEQKLKMQKNLMIGAAIGLPLLGLGYYFWRNRNES